MKKHWILPVVAVGFVSSMTLTGPAWGHASLTGTYPADGESVSVMDVVELTANEELLDLGGGAGFVFSVTDSDGHFYGDGCVVVDGTVASMPVQLGVAGEYAVAYRVVSADGHPIEGGWSFTYTPGVDATVGTAYQEMPVCGEDLVPVPAESDEPTPAATETAEESASTFDVVPFIGLATIPVIIGAIWLLVRSLGSRDSEDHLT